LNVIFLAPGYPPEMQQFTRGLAEVGARVLGVGDSHPGSFHAAMKRHLDDYLQVRSMLDEEDVFQRVLTWARGKRIDRIEANWEPVTVLAARLREALGIPGMSLDTVLGFRDKPLMRERVGGAGLRIPMTERVTSRAEAHAAVQKTGFPAILKPVAGAGSADTFRVDSVEDLDRALAQMGHHAEASCEEFITGEEFTYETITIDGVPVLESVCKYYPNALDARKNEWISPIILSIRDLNSPEIRGGVALGRQVLKALGMGTGFTHMEWYRRPNGEAVFGEIACRAPGANMVDLMNYTSDIDLYREWARAVCWHSFGASPERKYNAAIIFKRALGQGRIRHIAGLDAFRQRFGRWIAREDLLPIGAPRRDWKQTFLSDGNLVVRHPDRATAEKMAFAAATDIQVYAG
jgi:biotin carboxylase